MQLKRFYSKNKETVLKVSFLLVLTVIAVFSIQKAATPQLKLYWFIPDGVRAEPYVFNIYQWADEGKLPNIKKLMEMGSYGYSKPTFPSHTPTNFASLLTGTYPEVHGVDDGPMHVEGKPLDKVAIGGFRSSAKKVDPIWTTLENDGENVALISIPGSTPPEINKGEVVRGRWGGWGADFNAINFETKGNLSQRILQGRATKLFFFGAPLTQYLDTQTPSGWEKTPTTYSPALEVPLTGWGSTIYALIYDSTNDSVKNYDRVALSMDKKTIFADLKQGEWSDWQAITLKWKPEDTEINVDTNARVALIKIGNDGFFRIRVLYDNLNKYITQPENVATKLLKDVGPMVDFVDNFPPQLIYYPEDKKIFLDEANLSLTWHKNAVSAIIKDLKPNIVIHDTYTPNQMLTSRWWMGYIDPDSKRYNQVTPEQRDELWNEVKDMYLKLDDIVGQILKNSGPNTYIVFSSDHGAVPLNKWVNLNNLFARKGWLKFTIDPKTGEPIIDWKNSQVIYLKMAHIYINPNGLAGNYHRASGPAYEKLRNEVRQTLENLTDSDGQKPVVEVVNWEDAQEFMKLDPSRVGDLVVANAPGYGWNEEMSSNLAIFSTPLKTGYKQAIISDTTPGMWTPFIIAGPGVKKNNFLGNSPINMVDQYPTIMTALKKQIPDFVQGEVLPVFSK